MHAEVIVSRKTPGDGKLEIPRSLIPAIAALADPFPLGVEGSEERGTLVSMECSCRGANSPHVHYFLQSAALKRLAPQTNVRVDVTGIGVAVVSAAPRESP